MRNIGTLNNPAMAEKLRWYLLSRNIETSTDDSNSCDIWILNDRDRTEAKRLLDEYLQNPDDERYMRGETIARSQVQREVKEKKQTEKQATRLRKKVEGGFPITMFLFAGAALFYLLHFFDQKGMLFNEFLISQDIYTYRMGGELFREVKQGEIWRLFTPVFIHTSFLHIAFNLLWLYQLGRIIENFLGKWKMLAFVLLTGIISNVVFYVLISPIFGGMSGVIYGLFFFMWAADRFYPQPPFYLDDGTIKFFIVFYVISWFLSAFGIHTANTIHGTGAAIGVIMAYFFSGSWRLPRRRKNWSRQTIYPILIGTVLWAGGIITDIITTRI